MSGLAAEKAAGETVKQEALQVAAYQIQRDRKEQGEKKARSLAEKKEGVEFPRCVKKRAISSYFSLSFFAPSQKTQTIKQQLQQTLHGRYKEFLRLGGLLRKLFIGCGLWELDGMLDLNNDLRQGLSRRTPIEGTTAHLFFNRVKALTQHVDVIREFSGQKKVTIEEVAALEEKEVKALQAMDLLADIPLLTEAAIKAAAWQKDYRALCDKLQIDFNVFEVGVKEQIASTELFPKGVDTIVAGYYYRSAPRPTLCGSEG